MHRLAHDFRHALRRLRKSPGFAAVAILTLATGIGANTTIFSVMDSVLLRPLAIQDPSRVIIVQEQWRGASHDGVSVGNFADLRSQATSFASVGASGEAGFNLATDRAAENTPERVDGEAVTAGYFTTFGVQPIAGRVFTNGEDQP